MTTHTFPPGGLAVVIGATGALGRAFHERLSADPAFAQVIALSRTGPIAVDITSEASIASAAAELGDIGLPLRLVVDATGVLHGDGLRPEKSLQQLDATALARVFAVNAIGPALLMKHLLRLLPREGKSVFATLSAKVGSIGDNRLGGWYGYRASKAALNQFVRTAAIELRRTRPAAVCVALHPGTVRSALSAPFTTPAHRVQAPDEAAGALLDVLDRIGPDDSGSFLDYRGDALPW